MWFDCGNIFVNLDHVDYVQFEQAENAKATLYFESGGSLNFEHADIKVLKNHFKKIFEVKNEQSDMRSKEIKVG